MKGIIFRNSRFRRVLLDKTVVKGIKHSSDIFRNYEQQTEARVTRNYSLKYFCESITFMGCVCLFPTKHKNRSCVAYFIRETSFYNRNFDIFYPWDLDILPEIWTFYQNFEHFIRNLDISPQTFWHFYLIPLNILSRILHSQYMNKTSR